MGEREITFDHKCLAYKDRIIINRDAKDCEQGIWRDMWRKNKTFNLTC